MWLTLSALSLPVLEQNEVKEKIGPWQDEWKTYNKMNILPLNPDHFSATLNQLRHDRGVQGNALDLLVYQQS